MAIHKLQLDDFLSVDYELVAIHTSLEDHRLAYLMNRVLGIRLEKCWKDVSLRGKQGDSIFARFIYEDPESETVWNLLQNKSLATDNPGERGSLFDSSDFSSTAFLLPEFKKTDYILKVENTPSFFAPEIVTENLMGIKHVSTAYKIDHHRLKSKNNLIF